MRLQCHDVCFVFIGIVAPLESDCVIVTRQNSLVTYRCFGKIACKVRDATLRPIEGLNYRNGANANNATHFRLQFNHSGLNQKNYLS